MSVIRLGDLKSGNSVQLRKIKCNASYDKHIEKILIKYY